MTKITIVSIGSKRKLKKQRIPYFPTIMTLAKPHKL